MEKKDYLMWDNSILLLMDSDNKYNFKQALYKRNGVVGSVEKLEEPRSIIAEDIDIRYFNRVHDNKMSFFWIDIPDEMTLYVENQGKHVLYITRGAKDFAILSNMRVKIGTGKAMDYSKFVKYYREEIIGMPGIKELFCEERVYGEIEKDIHSFVSSNKKQYMMIQERDFTDGKDGTQRVWFTCVSGGVGLAITFEKYELARMLIEAGMEICLDTDEVVILMCGQDGKLKKLLLLTLLEVIVLYGDGMPDDFRAFLWKKIKASGAFVKGSFDFRYKYDYKFDKGLMQSVKYVQTHFKEAGNILLRALVRYYIKIYGLGEADIWKELFALFAGKSRAILEETVFREYGMGVNPSIWELYQSSATENETKETMIQTMHRALKEKNRRDNGDVENVVWFLVEKMKKVGDLGELCVEERDECVRLLLDRKEPQLELLRELLKTDFVPTEYMDFYIEILQNNHIGLTLSLFIAEKMRRG